MQHVFMFQWNIPAENQFSEKTDRYLNIIAEWDEGYYTDGTPMVYVNLVNPTIHDCIQVKDWYEAKCQIERIARKHFADIARQEIIEENPILQRLQNY